MYKYTNDEYERLLKHLDESWSKEETDYLFEQLERFDLRFIIVVDRWSFDSPSTRTVEDLKVRYYAIAKVLIEARAETPEEAAANQIVKMPFNPQHELDRKVALNTLLNRTNGEMKEEAEILAKVREIEKA
jgi:DNA methyltransferase 1-associated protein 1